MAPIAQPGCMDKVQGYAVKFLFGAIKHIGKWSSVYATLILGGTLAFTLYAAGWQHEIDFLETLDKEGLECTVDKTGVWQLEMEGFDISDPEHEKSVGDKVYNWNEDTDGVKTRFERLNLMYNEELMGEHVGTRTKSGSYLEALIAKMKPSLTTTAAEILGYMASGVALISKYWAHLQATEEFEEEEKNFRKKRDLSRTTKDAKFPSRMTCDEAVQQLHGSDKYQEEQKKQNRIRYSSKVMFVLAFGLAVFGLIAYNSDMGNCGKENEIFYTLFIQGSTFMGIYCMACVVSALQLRQNKLKFEKECEEYKHENDIQTNATELTATNEMDCSASLDRFDPDQEEPDQEEKKDDSKKGKQADKDNKEPSTTESDTIQTVSSKALKQIKAANTRGSISESVDDRLPYGGDGELSHSLYNSDTTESQPGRPKMSQKERKEVLFLDEAHEEASARRRLLRPIDRLMNAF